MDDELQKLLRRIADAIERAAPPVVEPVKWDSAQGFVWHAAGRKLSPLSQIAHLPLDLLQGIDHQRDRLLSNTVRFAQGLPANNALLWGARGTGKSALIKAVHSEVARTTNSQLKLVEIHRDDISSLGHLMDALAVACVPIILFCDDLSFDEKDTDYRSLKTVLEGGLCERPENVAFYATSNRRHLMPRDAINTENSNSQHSGEATEERVSLSDRFGLWLGFHNLTQVQYLRIVRGYAQHFSLNVDDAALEAKALEWSITRGSRSGRVAWQFIQDLAGELNQRLAVAVGK